MVLSTKGVIIGATMCKKLRTGGENKSEQNTYHVKLSAFSAYANSI